jgi:hypothetical protein
LNTAYAQLEKDGAKKVTEIITKRKNLGTQYL